MAVFTFELDFAGDVPLYEQLYRFVVAEIHSGRLREGERLPSKREVCAHLGVSRSTVESAYGILAAEGYIRTEPRVGFFVSTVEALDAGAEPPRSRAPERAERPRAEHDFSTGAVDTSAFPYASWAKLTRETVYGSPGLLQRGDGQGDMELRQALGTFLHQYRGVACRPEQIVVGAGIEYLLDLLIQLLPAGAVYAIEDPGYGVAARTIENNSRRVVPLPLDGEGISLSGLEKSGADVVYVTPSHQFPMGVTMPAGRRTRLLRWAAEGPDRYVVEDDYDSEFRYSSRPIPAMQGLDRAGRVVYIGTFSRSIAPGIRVAYMVLPESLLGLYLERFDYSACTVSRFEQHTLARFLDSGACSRHLRRMGNIYKRRCAYLTALLMELPGAEVSGADAGLHFLLTMRGMEERDMVERASRLGVRLRGLSEYCRGGCPRAGTVVLGYAGMGEDEISAAVAALKKAWTTL